MSAFLPLSGLLEHILEHGFITTEELKDKYGYNHPPRAARDVRENGIPLETFRVTASDGRKIGAYRFGDPNKSRFTKLSGRTAFSNKLKAQLVERDGMRCHIYLEEFPERDLQIDHRIPFEVAGDDPDLEENPDDFMLLSSSANRAKSWSCEHCHNWLEMHDVDVCKTCYWAYPENYLHVAMNNIRRVDVMWSGDEIKEYERIRERAQALGKNHTTLTKEILKVNL